jgi:hypothetical protein
MQAQFGCRTVASSGSSQTSPPWEVQAAGQPVLTAKPSTLFNDVEMEALVELPVDISAAEMAGRKRPCSRSAQIDKAVASATEEASKARQRIAEMSSYMDKQRAAAETSRFTAIQARVGSRRAQEELTEQLESAQSRSRSASEVVFIEQVHWSKGSHLGYSPSMMQELISSSVANEEPAEKENSMVHGLNTVNSTWEGNFEQDMSAVPVEREHTDLCPSESGASHFDPDRLDVCSAAKTEKRARHAKQVPPFVDLDGEIEEVLHSLSQRLKMRRKSL